MSHVAEFNSLEELSPYREMWHSLLAQTERATFFQSLDWLEAYWTHYGAAQKLRVLIVDAGGETLGILPLCIRTEPYKVGRLRVLMYPLHDWGTYYGPIGPNPTATLLAGLRYLRSTRRDWDLIDLRWIDNDRLDHGRTAAALDQAGFAADQELYNTSGVIDLAGSFEKYMSDRGTKWRNNLRRHERRMLEHGKLTHVRYRPAGAARGDGDPNWVMYDTCEAIARRSWQGSSPDGTTLSHDSVRAYFRDAHARAAQLGMLDMNLLVVGDDPVAFAYNYHYQGLLQGMRIGFDPEKPAEGAGNLLYTRIVEGSYALGDTQYDLGPGSLEAKRHLITATENSYRCTHFPVSVRAQALRAKRVVKHWWKKRQSDATPQPAAT